MFTSNYKSFEPSHYNSDSLSHFTLKESADGTYSLVPFNNEFSKNSLASDYSISSQLKSGVSLSEVHRIQPINRVAAADLGEKLMSNVINTNQNV